VTAAHDAIARVWKDESARVIGVLARIVRDLGVAEELAHDALVVALEEWPRTGVPDRPDPAAVVRHPDRLARVLDHDETPVPGDPHDRIQIAGQVEHVHGDDRADPRSDLTQHVPGVHRQGLVDVHQHRHRADGDHGGSR